MSASILPYVNLENMKLEPDEVRIDLPWYAINEQLDYNAAKALSETIPEHVSRIGGVELRPIFNSGEGVKVAVLDTGVSKLHIQRGELKIVDAKDYTGSRYGYDDYNGHGTHCCGIISAKNNDTGTSSILSECQLYVGKVLGDSGSGGDIGLSNGILWAVDQNVNIISMSWGGGYSTRIHEALKIAVSRGIICCAAAGNDGSRGTIYPARLDDVCLSVGAVDFNDKITSFSSRGEDVDMSDDGNNVYSTFRGGTYARLSGTSMSTPNLVAKIGALMALEVKHKGAVIKRTPEQIINLLQRWAVDRGTSGHDPSYGWGTVTTSFPQMITEYDEELGGIITPPSPPEFEPIAIKLKVDIPKGDYKIIQA